MAAGINFSFNALLLVFVNLSFTSAFLQQKVTFSASLSSQAKVSHKLWASEQETYTNTDIYPSIQQRKRRDFLQSAVLATTGALSPIFEQSARASDSTPELKPYKDSECKFEVSVPSTWEESKQTLPDRRKINFFVDPSSSDNDKPLIFIAYTTVRDDFTSLGSFGSIDQVGQMTILPKGQIAGVQDTESEMIKSESRKGGYFFDYTVKVDGQPKRHFRTIFSLVPGATGGAGSVLVTLTAQCLESQYDNVKGMFDKVIDSYDIVK